MTSWENKYLEHLKDIYLDLGHSGVTNIPETFPIAAMTAWDIVPEEKARFCSSKEMDCSK